MATTQLGAALRQIDRLYGVGSVAGLTDGQLLRRFLDRRDEPAFAALVARHGGMVLGIARGVLRDPHDVEDAFQATFLVLVRKAGSIRSGDALAGWLYRVARRVSIQAGAEASRRRRDRVAGPVEPAATPDGDEDRDHLRALVRDELGRLPERFRLPILLCDLEGLTREQAADRLQWTEGTLRGRLARGRERLKARLERRGVAVAGTLAATLAGRVGSAAVPASWAEAAVKAAMAYRAFRVIALGAVSESAATLGDRAIRAMLGARLRGLAAVATAMAAMGLVAAAMARPGAGDDEPPTPKSPDAPKAEMKRPGPRTPKAILSADRDAKEAPAGEIRYAGRVLDPDGKPIAGVRVYVPTRIYHDEEKPASAPPQLRATTGPGGRFDFAIPEAEFDKTWGNEPWKASTVIAQADGFGPGLANWTADELTLRLPADDTPIEGRLLDIQGRPVAGATVSVVGVLWNVEGDLTPFLDALQKEQEAYPVQYRMLKWWNDDSLSHLLPAVKSGDDGRFVIKGIGRERVASLWIEGPIIESTFVHARTRPGETLQIPDFGRQNFGGKVVYHGASADQVVGPTRPVVGTVRDKDTGKPLAGVTVQTTTAMGNPLRYVKTKTDEQGRYRLTGLPIGKGKYGDGQEVTALPPKDAPYIQVVHPLDEGSSLSPVTRDFDLKRGVWIEGRVIDGATGKPVRARLDYFVYADNPHRQDYPGFGTNRVGMPLTTDAEGRFQIPGIPGKGILGARAEEKYRLGAGKDTLEGLEMLGDAEAVARTYPSFCIPTNYHVVAMVDPPADAESATVDLVLDPGKAIPGRVVGPDGEPVEGASLYGLTDHFRYWQGASGSTFEVLSMAPDAPRLVQARHESKQLAGSVVATADAEAPLTLRLAPWGTLTGRIVDDAGQPRAGLELTSDGIDHETGATPDRVKVDADGRFRVDGVVPGLKYTLQVWDGKTVVGSVGGGVVVAPGETKDLGDVEAKAREAGE